MGLGDLVPAGSKKTQGGLGSLVPTGAKKSNSGLGSLVGGGDDLESKAGELEDDLGIDALARGALDVAAPLSNVLIDLLSRGNYATAGAFEEGKAGHGLGTAFKRAGREIFSGLPGVQGEKRTFGQVFERLGYGEGGRFSQLAPFLYSDTGAGPALQEGGPLDPTARGTAGQALDIFADPTTYLTFGASAGTRVVGKRGAMYLSEEGTAAWRAIQAKYAPEVRAALSETDDTLRLAADRTIRAKKIDEIDALVDADKKLLHPGGIRYFGETVVPAEDLIRVSSHVRDALLEIPGGPQALRGAAAFSRGTGAVIRGLFSPRGVLSDLPPGMQEVAFQMRRDFTDANGLVRGKLLRQASEIWPEWDKLSKASPDLGEKFYHLREGTKKVTLTEPQQKLYDRVAGLYDQMDAVNAKLGTVDPEQLAQFQGRYFHHAYVNRDDLSEVAAMYGRPGSYPKTTEKFQRARVFDSYQEALDVSTELNRQTMAARMAGKVQDVYPILEPNYDVMNNLASYIHQHSEAVARKLWYEDAARVFGKRIDDYDPLAIYEMTRPRNLPPADTRAIGTFFGDSKNLRALAREVADEVGGTAGKHADMGALLKDAGRVLPKLGDDGRRAFLSELLTRVRSPSQAAQVFLELEPKYGKWIPTPRVVQAGDIEPSLAHFGEQARYVQRSGGLWGDKPILLPDLLIKDIENFNTKLFESRLWPGIQKGLQLWDGANNWFKMGVYTFWPASATRDAYSNVALSFLDIGVGALARPRETARVLRGTSDAVRVGAHELAGKEWRRLADQLGVRDPGGRSFVQMTGQAQFKPGGRMARAVAARANIDNFSRVQLWLNNIAHGLDPRDAADKVAEFLFRYDELSPFERDVLKRAVPFYTYPKKAIELHMRLLGRKPGVVATEIKPFRGREDENSQLVSWEAGALKLRLDRDGKTVRMLTGIDLPIRTLDNLWSGTSAKTIRRQLGTLSPLFKTPVEMATGTDMFTGRKLGAASAPALGRAIEALGTPKAVRDWLGYNKTFDDAGRPRYTVDSQNGAYLLLRSWAFSRVLTTSDRQFREYFAKDPQVGASMLDFLTGLRLKEINLDEQQQRRLKERIRELEELGVRKGKLREHSIKYKTQEAAP